MFLGETPSDLYPQNIDLNGKQHSNGHIQLAVLAIAICLAGGAIAAAFNPGTPVETQASNETDSINAVAKGTANPINEANLALMQAQENFDIFVAIMPEHAFDMLKDLYNHAQILESRMLEDYEDDDIVFCVFHNGERYDLDEKALVSAIASR